MNRTLVALLITAAMTLLAAAQNQPKDPIGLTATQRQMIAWSIAGFAHLQRLPQGFRPAIGAKIPDQLRLRQIPHVVTGEAPPIRNYQYVMLRNKDLLLINPRDKTIADVIHLNRRL